ncbi:hypothetical protein EOL96_00880 [Candidatus Saccharibacteria bacterium]|nr:hypothetical protein [Candidatus Saccharibacteria bacterium]
MSQRRGVRLTVAILGVCILVTAPRAYAETLQSTNYQFSEPTVGAGSLTQSSSASYIGQSGIGDLGVGNSASSNFQINAGSQTSPDPVLSVSIASNTADFGNFSASDASTTTASFTIINYTSYGYAVQLTGSPPSYSGHTLTAMTTTSPSQSGIEQFGINMVANTLPISFGDNPDNGDFGFGQVGSGPLSPDYANYSTPNEYRYVPGEIIASAPKSSGETIYTISFLANVSGVTPSGKYLSNQILIVTGTY